LGSQYDEEQIAKFKEVNRLLKQALEQCEKLVREAELANQQSGQDNDPPDQRPLSGI
jgi:hypothetical protein